MFDGDKKNINSSKNGNVKVVFSKKGMTADTLIESYLTNKRDKTIVISSDRDLSSICILRGSRVIRSEDFESYILDYLGQFYEKNKNVSHSSFKDKVKNNALLSLLKELKEERERYEQEKLLKEMKRLKAERKLRIETEKKELEELRKNGKTSEQIKKENEEALRLFHDMYGDKKQKSKKNKIEEEDEPSLIIEDEDFDWVSAMENSFDDFEPKK
jgi:hypothetical protein